MSMSHFVFYLISIMIFVFGLLTVISKKIFRSAIYLLFTLINVAALFFYLNFEFLAAVQVVVYVGGIVVLILFSLFLTHQVEAELPVYPKLRKYAAAFAVVFGFVFSYTLILTNAFPETGESKEITMNAIGKQLLNYGDGGYILPFEAISILLLAAMVGCIAIALKTKKS